MPERSGGMAVPRARAGAPQQHGRLQPKLSALIAEVRAMHDELDRALARQAIPGRDDPSRRARLLDQWIRQAHGRRQLVCLACGAEHGILEQDHLELGRQTAARTTDRALRALYWASVQRWSRAPGTRQAFQTPLPSRTPPATAQPGQAAPHMCGHCHDLSHDIRRFSPHEELERDSAGARLKPRAFAECRYRCGTCDTCWVRRVPPSEPFAVWAVVPARHAAPMHA
ncbi:hypothetical protein [Cupriavidus campinensis]